MLHAALLIHWAFVGISKLLVFFKEGCYISSRQTIQGSWERRCDVRRGFDRGEAIGESPMVKGKTKHEQASKKGTQH